jgi:ribonuclease P/MRP protein subunit POP8
MADPTNDNSTTINPIDNPSKPAPPPSTRKPTTNRGHILSSLTLTPPHTYIHLSLLSTSPQKSTQPLLSELTAKTYLTRALHQFLGLHGTAISIDILKVSGQDVWIRVPREDRAPVLAALGGWNGNGDGEDRVGWVVKAAANWLGSLVAKEGGSEIWND